MLRKIRIVLALVFWIGVTVLFLDATGVVSGWLGWMAKVQFIPAVLALNVGVIVFLAALTLLFGRVYCSVICPLGVFQDIASWLSGLRRGKRFRFGYAKALTALRLVMLGVMVGAMIAGIGIIVAVLDPYSAYGRMVSSFLIPAYDWVNSLLAGAAERADSYMFFDYQYRPTTVATLSVAGATLVAIVALAWWKGRWYCNSICPVGTILGVLSRYALFGVKIDVDKCNSCGLCSRGCKGQCINGKAHEIDNSRCVGCMDCIDICKHGAISYGRRNRRVDVKTAIPVQDGADTSRREFLSLAALMGTTAAVKGAEKFVDGGLAAIEEKKTPNRETKPVPPGAQGIKHFHDHCTACQLCVSRCPHGVLTPSTDLDTLLHPEMSFENGYCRPECNVCSSVCPAGAIKPVTVEDRTAIQVGHAVWVRDNCVPVSENLECGNCARHCPAGAITMVPSEFGNEDSVKIPSVNAERCIGCGACENLCPSRPFSAIYVEGHRNHRVI
ncbi:MAG: 4Fe-4S binding protein [Muribaculaceae bacterium]|nr:4Fe-4S binding protein [Muribaculaceae bacterium]